MSVFSAAALCFPAMSVLFVLFKQNAYSHRFSPALARCFKGGATFFAFLLGLFGLVRNYSTAGLLVCLGVLIGAIADVVLDIHFNAGACVFALGHVCYGAGFILYAPPSIPQFILLFLLTEVVCFSFIKGHDRLDARFQPFTLYALVLCAILALGVFQKPVLACGCVLFVLSDALLAKNIVLGSTRLSEYISLGTYYLAQFLIGLSLCL